MVETLRKQTSLKALAHKVLAGNLVGNFEETRAENRGNLLPSESPKKFPTEDSGSVAHDGHRDWNDLPDGPPSGATVGTFNQEAMDVVQTGGNVPVWSTVLEEWLWFVRDEKAKAKLVAEGCQVPIYTLGELAVVVDRKLGPGGLKDVHAVKKLLGATIEPPTE